MNRVGRLIAVLVLCSAAPSPVEAKCARLLLGITGEVKGDPNQELAIRFESVPDGNERQSVPVRDGTGFVGKLLFDPTKGYSRLRGHDCSRRPKVVRGVLVRGDEVVESKELSFARDFVEESSGRYRLREPIILDGGADHRQR